MWSVVMLTSPSIGARVLVTFFSLSHKQISSHLKGSRSAPSRTHLWTHARVGGGGTSPHTGG